jgi:hypothetical protein
MAIWRGGHDKMPKTAKVTVEAHKLGKKPEVFGLLRTFAGGKIVTRPAPGIACSGSDAFPGRKFYR